MIDTIILRIHNLKSYPVLYEQFYMPEKREAVTKAMVDHDTGEVVAATQIGALIFHDSNRVLPLVHRNNINLASSHYSVSYVVNLEGDYLEFNFSIPKYLFATNVMQFVNIYDTSASSCFLELKRFLNKFLKEELLQQPIPEDIEINRIDLCYNQFFNSKEESLKYLEAQKEVNIKYARSSRNKFRNYETSLMYVTRRYSFKIYHKGTEFKKNDYRELAKDNKKGYDLQKLLDISDCILRYEMTFRRSMLTYIMEHYFFNSHAQAENPFVREHVLVKVFQDILLFGGSKLYEKFKKSAKKFCIKSPFDYSKKITWQDMVSQSNVTFDLSMFTLCFNIFWKKVKDYQVTQIMDYYAILNKIKELNDNTDLQNKIAAKKKNGKDIFRLMVVGMLSQFKSVDELKPFMSERAFYRLKADLKKIGINGNQTNLNIPTPKLDYSDYQMSLIYWHNWYG
jgi:hypothetical protein